MEKKLDGKKVNEGSGGSGNHGGGSGSSGNHDSGSGFFNG